MSERHNILQWPRIDGGNFYVSYDGPKQLSAEDVTDFQEMLNKALDMWRRVAVEREQTLAMALREYAYSDPLAGASALAEYAGIDR